MGVTGDFRGCESSCWPPSVLCLQSATWSNTYCRRKEVQRDLRAKAEPCVDLGNTCCDLVNMTPCGVHTDTEQQYLLGIKQYVFSGPLLITVVSVSEETIFNADTHVQERFNTWAHTGEGFSHSVSLWSMCRYHKDRTRAHWSITDGVVLSDLWKNKNKKCCNVLPNIL